jgi:hypothetical protein
MPEAYPDWRTRNTLGHMYLSTSMHVHVHVHVHVTTSQEYSHMQCFTSSWSFFRFVVVCYYDSFCLFSSLHVVLIIVMGYYDYLGMRDEYVYTMVLLTLQFEKLFLVYPIIRNMHCIYI